MLNIKLKRLTPTAKIPTKAHTTDAGYDLYNDMEEGDCKNKTTNH